MPGEKRTGGKYDSLLIAYWTALILLLAALNIYSYHLNTLDDARAEARDYFRLSMFYRRWAAQMGGVYVPTDRIPPNRYLKVPDRDIAAADGKSYTLVNPAYMTRMVFDSINASAPFPLVGRITSLNPINPGNAPDEWERLSLEGFERREYTERVEVVKIKDAPYLRFISAFITEDVCLGCHGFQGYHSGDVRGGITISVPLTGRYALERKTGLRTLSGYFIVWLLGCCGIIKSGRDQRKYQQELEANEENLRTVCEWTTDWDYWVYTDGRMRYVSPSCYNVTHYTREEFMNDPQLVYRIIHPDHHAAFSEHASTHLSTECAESRPIDFKIITRDGEVRWIQHHCTPIVEGGHFKGRRVSNRDITEQMLASEKLGRLSAIVESSEDAIISESLDHLVTSWNHGAEKVFGYSEREIVGNSLLCLLPSDREHEEKEILDTIVRGESVEHFETVRVHKDGRLLDVSVTISPIRDHKSGVMIGASTIARDITDLRREAKERAQFERQMLHAQKLESLGVLAGGIAHDFNNILLAIIGNADLALMRMGGGESPAKGNLLNVKTAASRAADLTRQMLAYSGKGAFAIENIDLNVLLQEMTHMLEVSISKHAELKFRLENPLPSVAADATQIRQIIMNLVINASEAIGERSGTITISTGHTNCDRRYLQQLALDKDIAEGNYAYLEIADTGCGMDRATIERIFEPFFTTKFTGRGLGMAAVQGIIRGHKGAIKIYSEPGHGTTFKVLLPAARMPADLPETAPAVDVKWQGNGTVLLVDDEESVLKIGSDMLREMGFDVVTAVNGRQAIEGFKAKREEISCVILDLTMPEMDGEHAFCELRELSPQLKVIMSSGYNQVEVVHKFTGRGLSGFIQKPYTFTELKDALCRVLSEAS